MRKGILRGRAGVWAFLVLVLAGLSLHGVGCGSSTTVDTLRGSRLSLLNIRNGKWRVEQTWTYSGPGDCATRPESTLVDTTLKCDVGFVSPFQITCDTTTVEGVLYFDCTGTANLDPCYLHLDMSGQGSTTDTTFSFTAVQVQGLTAASGQEDLCEEGYGSYASPCTTTIVAQGTWLDTLTTAEKNDLCPDDNDTLFPPFVSPGTPTGP